MAAKDVLVRDLPEEIGGWLVAECHQRGMTQKELIHSILADAAGISEQPALFSLLAQPIEKVVPGSLPFTFIDLFAGIGGLRLGLEAVGGNSIFSSEWDKYCQRTYRSWFGETPHGDITKLDPSTIPDHDVLAAGFPCQPFSIAGVSKKNALGRPHGFKDATQGNLFFNLATIIQLKRPPVLVLENVKNLQSHDSGRTWKVINETLESFHYTIFAKVINARHWVPQHRERIFIVGFDKYVFGERPPFEFPEPPTDRLTRFRDILEPEPDRKYTLSDHLWNYLQDYAAKHKEQGNGFGFGLADLNGHSRTLSARYFKDGSEILIPQEGSSPRRLTPFEAGRLMGFPMERLHICVSDTQAYKQFGNAVVPPVAEAVAGQIVKVLGWHLQQRSSNGCLVKQSSTGNGNLIHTTEEFAYAIAKR